MHKVCVIGRYKLNKRWFIEKTCAVCGNGFAVPEENEDPSHILCRDKICRDLLHQWEKEHPKAYRKWRKEIENDKSI